MCHLLLVQKVLFASLLQCLLLKPLLLIAKRDGLLSQPLLLGNLAGCGLSQIAVGRDDLLLLTRNVRC